MACRHSVLGERPRGCRTRRDRSFLLSETLRMIESSDMFEVLAHIDYPVRGWPAAAGMFDPADFEDEFRAVLHALASSGRVLEVNTRFRFRPRSSAGGTRLAARRSPSAVTLTNRHSSGMASRMPRRWSKHTASTRARTPTTSGADDHRFAATGRRLQCVGDRLALIATSLL